MPIAAYTLDGKSNQSDLKPHIFSKNLLFSFSPDGFNVKKIRIIEPPGTRKSTPAHTANSIINSTTGVPAVSRKRPFDNIDDSSSESKEAQKQRPPRKKARIDVHALVFPELYDPQPCPKKKKSPFKKHDIQEIPRYSIFPKPSGKASRAANQRFLSQIRHHQTSADNIS
jgi:hypothetical protein